MKTCLIYGQNGLDLDVTFNLKTFYSKLGFKVFFSDKLYNTNLLVVVRAVDQPLSLSKYTYSLIHVFDYVGWNYDSFIKSIDHSITFVFCSSEKNRRRLINNLHFPENHVFIAFPPVDVNLWVKKINNIKYEFIHIGNFKKIETNDEYQKHFAEALKFFNAHIWGKGWKFNNRNIHGKINLFSVSSVYSKSKHAFGLMYPFQRECTFSGRFWHAPLNGCLVFSEPGIYTKSIPGIVETNYKLSDIILKSSVHTNRNYIQEIAIKFWNKEYNKTLKLASYTLSNITFSDSYFRLYVLNILIINNLLKKYYHKIPLHLIKINFYLLFFLIKNLLNTSRRN